MPEGLQRKLLSSYKAQLRSVVASTPKRRIVEPGGQEFYWPLHLSEVFTQYQRAVSFYLLVSINHHNKKHASVCVVLVHAYCSVSSELGEQGAQALSLLAGMVSVVPGISALATGLKEGDRYLQTRRIVKVRLYGRTESRTLACLAFVVASTHFHFCRTPTLWE